MENSQFEAEEIMKVLKDLGILETDESNDKSEYFNAWSFGQQKGNYEYAIETEIIDSNCLNL